LGTCRRAATPTNAVRSIPRRQDNRDGLRVRQAIVASVDAWRKGAGALSKLGFLFRFGNRLMTYRYS
jgi:hypothetical protein